MTTLTSAHLMSSQTAIHLFTAYNTWSSDTSFGVTYADIYDNTIKLQRLYLYYIIFTTVI